jgi:16S rRNA (cytosine1402-N4)-methyltransferase
MNKPELRHVPVLLEETVSSLAPHASGRYLDGTVGLGGHAERILEVSSPGGRLIGLDRDPDALAEAKKRLSRFGTRAQLVHASYTEAQAVAGQAGMTPLSGFLLDLGVSSLQLDRSERGFSFRTEGPLDMRFDPASGEPAATLVNSAPEEELADVIWRYGEERASRRIARAIVQARPLRTTTQLARVVERVAGRPGMRTSPATRTFQALRIAVNGELDNLSRALESTRDLLEVGGRLAVITFHSLEDRIVKQFIQRESRDCICPPGLPECRCGHMRSFAPLNRSSVAASDEESRRNPRSRSARLRTAVRL